MAGKIRGPQIEVSPDGIDTANINAGAISADAAGRALMATDVFDSATVTAKFAAGAIALDRLVEAVIQADGGQAFAADQPMGGFTLTGLKLVPGADAEAASKAYVDSQSQGLNIKESCKVRAQIDITIAAPGANIDGIAMGVGDRFLATLQGTPAQDGIYVWAGAAVPATRADDFPVAYEARGSFTFIEEGTDADTGWVCTDNDGADVVGTHDLTFAQFSSAGAIIAGNGLTQAGNTIHVGPTSVGITINADSIDVDYGLVGAITSVNAGDTAAAGVANAAARSDHEHAVATATPGAIQPDDAAAEGVSVSLARADHAHSIVAAVAGTIQPDDAAAEGVATSFSRSDHQHAIVTSAPVSLGASNAEGAATGFVRASHVHARDIENVESITTELITASDTAMTDLLDATPLDVTKVRLYLNGVQQIYGAGNDFTITGTTITWLAATGTAVNQKTGDALRAVYDSQG